MTRAWHKYLIYISLVFLAIALIKADYLKIPTIYSNIALIVSFLFLFLGFIANALAQQQLLAKSGFVINIFHSLSMVGLTMFGKYIPGKMWMVVGKAAYIAARTDYKLVDLSVLFVRAQFIAIWCGLIVGIIGLLINNALDYLSWIGLLILTGLTLVLFSQTANNAAERLVNKLSKNPITITRLNIPQTLKVLPWFLSSWLFWGIGFYILAASISNHAIPISTAFCFPLAGTLGILFLLAPGGVGVREGIIVGYLTLAQFNLTEAVTIAAASRLWFLIGEFFIFAVGFVCDRLTARDEQFKDIENQAIQRRPENDYTRKKYARLVECLADRYPAYGILDYTLAQRSQRLPESYFIMRHDVDANIRNALAMAQIDARNGIRATYYFRIKPFIFNPGIVKQIADLGHEIGYHYEVLSDTRGDFQKAIPLFEANLKKIRSLAPVETVCMHGQALSPHNNLDFWTKSELADYDLIAEPYLTIDYTDKYYFSDTSLRWNNHKYNLRDHVESLGNHNVKSTDELIAFLESPGPKKGAILTHTNFWVDNWLSWSFNRILFFGLNQVKQIKKKNLVRKTRNQSA